MSPSTKVSVIIPSFNEEKNIAACLESILNQSEKNYEVIVVDDGSTDNTKEIIKKYEVVFLEQSHKGPAKARNFGAKHAKGEVLVFMDSDMTFSQTFLKELTDPILRGEIKGDFSKEEYISNWENIWARCWNYNQNWPSKKMIPDDYPDEGFDFRGILKSEFDRVGGFDDTGYTDTWSLAKKLGYRPKAVRGAKYYHVNPDNLSEVFTQSKWVAKRDYKFGVLGKIIALLRVSLPISLVMGFYKAAKFREIRFVLFKLIYDLGAFFGILEMVFKRKLSK